MTERKYHTYEKEALAIIYCVTYFRPYSYGRKFTFVTDHKPLVWFQNSKDPWSRVTRWKLKLAEYDFDVAYKSGKTLSRNPIDVENIEHNYINNKNSIEVNLVKPRNAKCISDLEYKKKVPVTDLACHKEINYDNLEEDIEENNFKETEQFINKRKLFKNRNKQGNYDELKYKNIEDENIITDNCGGNERIPINDENLIKDIKNKEYKDINYEDFEK